MNRRGFIAGTAAMAVAGSTYAQDSAPRYSTADAAWQAAYDKAMAILAANVQVMPRYDRPVLIEGATYKGIWMECGPHEALVYRKVRPDVARAAHMTFFTLQRPDGQLPANNKLTEAGFGQIQMVVPIAATAWELARATGDEALLHAAYEACGRWDAWLLRYRNTRGTGLTEGFCTYDTGHDNSPRWAGIPPQCPNKDARLFPPGHALPRLCPDLSATTYGARRALAAMAAALGKPAEADRWTEAAETIRKRILDTLYVPPDAAFYDLDADGKFVRVRSDILSRMCGEHVVDQNLFDDLWTRQLHNPKAFWTPYPLPSIAADDPAFVRPIPVNSWGGASQALTALRAGRWMDHYGRSAEFARMMDAWGRALIADMGFRQQMDPVTGAFTQGEPDYSPAALVMMDYTWRLAGITEQAEDLYGLNTLCWNVRPDHAAARQARFAMRTDTGKTAEMRYHDGGAELRLAGKAVARIEGTARLVTGEGGKPLALAGISPSPQTVVIETNGRRRKFLVRGNQQIRL
jgi:hypothetical protein